MICHSAHGGAGQKPPPNLEKDTWVAEGRTHHLGHTKDNNI